MARTMKCDEGGLWGGPTGSFLLLPGHRAAAGLPQASAGGVRGASSELPTSSGCRANAAIATPQKRPDTSEPLALRGCRAMGPQKRLEAPKPLALRGCRANAARGPSEEAGGAEATGPQRLETSKPGIGKLPAHSSTRFRTSASTVLSLTPFSKSLSSLPLFACTALHSSTTCTAGTGNPEAPTGVELWVVGGLRGADHAAAGPTLSHACATPRV